MTASNPIFFLGLAIAAGILNAAAEPASSGNRLAYLDGAPDPYYVGNGFARLTTPQWIGKSGVVAAVVLSIDDMRETGRYESFLRPVLDRLKKIDGRAPVSIFTNSIDPGHSRLQSWLNEGLSIEVHTIGHPCPLLQGGNFAAAKRTVDDCVDLLAGIPNMSPVCFRMPCCDSQNSVSPRYYGEIFNKRTAAGNFLRADSSVFTLFTGTDRFAKYIPRLRGFINYVENYPYPYVIGGKCWELPGNVPSDWEIQNTPGGVSPETALADLKAAVDLTVGFEGLFTYVFHPNNWGGIGPQQIVELIDHAVAKHGEKIVFLNAREVTERLTKNALAGHPLRASDGSDNGVRLLDVNADGFMDVVIGQKEVKMTRLWRPETMSWDESKEFPVQIDGDVRFGVVGVDGFAAVAHQGRMWEFAEADWKQATPQFPEQTGVLRDIDGDGICEWLGNNVFRRTSDKAWESLPFTPPSELLKAGSRLVDLDGDRDLDLVFSDAEEYSVRIFESLETGWTGKGKGGRRGTRTDDLEIPMIVRADGSDNGSWIHGARMIWQNEDSVSGGSQIVSRDFNDLCTDFATVLTSKPLEPEASLEVMHVNSNFEIQLAASEPVVMDPIDIAWGTDGRVWVVEMADYPLGIDGKGKPGGRVRWMIDANNDGRFEESTVFLDGLQTPTGVMAWRDGVLVLAPPELIYAEDRDADGAADHRQVILTGFVEGNQQHRVNGLRWGLDNWVYIANGDSGGVIRSNKTGQSIDIRGRDLRVRPDTGEIEAQTGQTQYGRNRDDWGNWFGCSNSNLMWHFALADHYLSRNPHIAPPDPTVNIYRGSGRPVVFPRSAALERFNGPAELNRITSACGANIYRDRVHGGSYYGNAFICEPVHNLVHRETLVAEGTTFFGQRPDEEQHSEFLASEDHWFRPVSVRTGPDGALWIADMYRLVIEHPEWIPDDWEERLDLRAGHDRGRIYRIVRRGGQRVSMPVLADKSALQLVAMLESGNGPTRDLAHQMLTWKEAISVAAVDALERMVEKSNAPLARMQALCVLDGIDMLAITKVHGALADPHPGVRRHAVRLSEKFESSPPNVAQLVEDEDLHVRLQLAYSLGEWKDEAAGAALVDLALHHTSGDRFIAAAAVSSALPHLGVLLPAVLGDPDAPEALRNALIRTAAASEDKRALMARVLTVRQNEAIDARRLRDVATVLAAIGGNAVAGDAALLLYLDASRKAIEGQDPAETLAAIAMLAFSDDAADSRLLARFLNADQRLDYQRAAVAAYARGNLPDVEAILIDHWRNVSPQLRMTIATHLCGSEAGARRILDRVEKEPDLAAVVSGSLKDLLLSHQQEGIRTRAAQLLPVPPQRNAVLEEYRAALNERGIPAADPEIGKDVFQRNCAVCHVLDGLGYVNVGADLEGLTDKSPEALLVAILDPNRAVEDKFGSYVVELKSGAATVGVIAAETSTSLELRLPDGSLRTILRKNIGSITNTGRSLMPEGLEAAIAPDEFVDLVAWLSLPRQPRRTFPNNKRKRVVADAAGVFNLEPRHASIYGSRIVLEERYGNLGFWDSEHDSARWEIDCQKAGRYSVECDYALPVVNAGNKIRIQAHIAIDAPVPATGSWDTYKTMEIGELQLPAGRQIIEARPAVPLQGFLMDLRRIRLVLKE